jgi:hypothetical protein
VSWYRKPETMSSFGSGSIGSRSSRRRMKAARADGENSVSARAWIAVGGQSSTCVAPQTETAVRRASIGFAVRGSARSVEMTADGTRPVVSRAFGSHSPVQRRFATDAYDPCATRSPIR